MKLKCELAKEITIPYECSNCGTEYDPLHNSICLHCKFDEKDLDNSFSGDDEFEDVYDE